MSLVVALRTLQNSIRTATEVGSPVGGGIDLSIRAVQLLHKGVRYYSPHAATRSTIGRSRITTIRKETAIVPENEAGYVDAQEAAKTLGMSQRAVRNLVARGSLEPRRDGEGVAARLVVSVASVERLRSERNQ